MTRCITDHGRLILRMKNHCLPFFVSLLGTLLFAISATGADPAEQLAEEPAEPETAENVSPDETPAAVNFDLIRERNIFDPDRRAPRTRDEQPKEQIREPRIDIVSLTGIMTYSKGTFAFFDGSSSLYREAVKAGDSFVGYTIDMISNTHVQLKKDEQLLELRIGQQLRREDDGEWAINSNAETFTASNTTATADEGSNADTSNPADAGGPSDALKRLLEKRKKELDQ